LISEQLLLSDTKTFFSKEHAWQAPGGGGRNARWAIIIEKDGTVSYAEVEPTRGVKVCIMDLLLLLYLPLSFSPIPAIDSVLTFVA